MHQLYYHILLVDLNANDLIDLKVSYEDAVMGISVFSESGTISFVLKKESSILFWLHLTLVFEGAF